MQLFERFCYEEVSFEKADLSLWHLLLEINERPLGNGKGGGAEEIV